MVCVRAGKVLLRWRWRAEEPAEPEELEESSEDWEMRWCEVRCVWLVDGVSGCWCCGGDVSVTLLPDFCVNRVVRAEPWRAIGRLAKLLLIVCSDDVMERAIGRSIARVPLDNTVLIKFRLDEPGMPGDGCVSAAREVEGRLDDTGFVWRASEDRRSSEEGAFRSSPAELDGCRLNVFNLETVCKDARGLGACIGFGS